MAALFPRWSNSVFAAALVLLGAGAVGVPACFMIAARTPYVTGQYRPVAQPVAFDHRHHVGDDGIDCRYCHDLVERAASAGIPPTERCLGCHGQIWSASPLLAPVWRSWETGEPIPWVRVHALPGFVYFDHSAHWKGGVACASCHGRVDRMARVYQAAPLTMQWCLDCHRSPEGRLVPREQRTAMPPPAAASPSAGGSLAARYGVDPGTDCTTCHR